MGEQIHCLALSSMRVPFRGVSVVAKDGQKVPGQRRDILKPDVSLVIRTDSFAFLPEGADREALASFVVVSVSRSRRTRT